MKNKKEPQSAKMQIHCLNLRLDRQDFKLKYDAVKVHFRSLLIELLTHKLTASF